MYGATGRGARSGWHAGVPAERLSVAVQRRFGADLELIDSTPAGVASKVLLASAGFLLGTLSSVAALAALGALEPAWWWPAAALAVGALAGWTSFRGVVNRVERARRALRQAANDFVQLVAVGLTTDQSVEEAISFALDVGAGEGFDRLRRQIVTAPQRGVPVWDAIDEVGGRHDVRELREFAVCVERQGTQGVSIGDSVAALATGMRAKALDELEREADRANANLSGPTVGFVVATVVFLAYPLAQRISDAFGG
jgi:Flp pilus assembly protein TadB